MTTDPLEPVSLTKDDLKTVRNQTWRVISRDSGTWILFWTAGVALMGLVSLGMATMDRIYYVVILLVLTEMLVVMIPRLSEYGSLSDVRLGSLFLSKGVVLSVYLFIAWVVDMFSDQLPTPDQIAESSQMLSASAAQFLSYEVLRVALPMIIATSSLGPPHISMMMFYHEHPHPMRMVTRGGQKNPTIYRNHFVLALVMFISLWPLAALVRASPAAAPLVALALVALVTYRGVREYVLFKHIYEGGGGLYEPARQTRTAEAT